MRTRQDGIAIVLALGVVALAALAATAMMVSQSTWSRQVELGTAHVQAQFLLQAGLDWARAVLSDDRRVTSVDHPGETWALQLPPIPVEGGSLSGRIEDQQGRFNLNNLLQDGRVNTAQLAHFRRLLAILDLPPALADALVEWIGPADPPAATSARSLLDIADLALVDGFDAGVRARLRPFVAALPRFTAVNVNTAAPEVIAAVVDGLALDDARSLVAQREGGYFRNFSDFFRELPPGLIVPNEDISVHSSFFLATMGASIDGAQANGSALLVREDAGWPAIAWRKYP